MNEYMTSERGQQILIAALKAHGIRHVIASPGTANMSFVVSIQNDKFFNVLSSIDERSAAYIACGLSAELDEPVVITCTEATASRNYLPGLTEAYYRKLPILAVTCNHGEEYIGQMVPQVIDRRSIPNDVANLSVNIPFVKDKADEWCNTIKINQAILELKRRGGGPVHINLATHNTAEFHAESVKPSQIIKRYFTGQELPPISAGRVGIFIGSHKRFAEEMVSYIDRFCEKYNAVVFCDQTSNYFGRYRVNFSIVSCQENYSSPLKTVDLLIHLGEVSGEYWHVSSKNTWRVSDDGEIKDAFKGSLTTVFEMPEKSFFEFFVKDFKNEGMANDLYQQYCDECSNAYNKIPELPLSNAWIAKRLHKEIPKGAVLHFGILNSLRAWNLFDTPQAYMTSCNVGGFGIDGCLSTMIGASLANPNRIHFAFLGDLAFFYDMNALGNRHVANNIRILVVNNGKGTEFRMYWHPAYQLGDDADRFVAAGGHYGNKSALLIKSYVEALGYKYLCANNKEEFEANYKLFVSEDQQEKPIVFEVFTDSEDETRSISIMRSLIIDSSFCAKKMLRKQAKSMISFIKNKMA